MCIQILEFLSSKTEMGATNRELVDRFGPGRKMLLKSLQLLQNLRMVLQTGVIEVTFVHCLFTTPWLVGTYTTKRLPSTEKAAVPTVPFQLIRVADWATTSSFAAGSRKRKRNEGESSVEQDDSQIAAK